MVCRSYYFCIIALGFSALTGCANSPQHPVASEKAAAVEPSSAADNSSVINAVNNSIATTDASIAATEPVAKPNIAIESPASLLVNSVPATAAPKSKNSVSAKSAVPVAKVLAVPPVVVTLEKLPMQIGAWTLDRMGAQCVLKSPIAQMDDGQGGTPVSMVLSRDTLRVHTRSEIDSSYSGSGIAIDTTKSFALEKIDNKTDAVFIQQRAALLNAMQQGRVLAVTLGFWPTWPITHTYATTFALQDFATALSAWDACNRQLDK